MAFREIADYPKYILRLPKGDAGKLISNGSVRIASKSFDELWDHHHGGIFRTLFVCAAHRRKSIILCRNL